MNRLIRISTIHKRTNLLPTLSSLQTLSRSCTNDVKTIDKQEEVDEDMPINMKNPYKEEKPCCVLCKYNIEVNYKNPRLLSQFISTYTGLIYDRNITGLCAKQYEVVKYHIKIAQWLNLMPRFYKHQNYHKDPQLFNPFKPIRENNV